MNPLPRRNRPRGRRRDPEPERENPLRTESQRLACKQKQRFATAQEADDAVYRARMEGTTLGTYKCQWCNGWHLTSRDG